VNQPVADREIIFVVEESPEGGYQARAQAIRSSPRARTLKNSGKCCTTCFCHFDPENKPAISRPYVIK